MRVRGSLLALTAGLVALGCESQEDQRARLAAARDSALQVARADSVAQAEAQYDPAVFDSIRWDSNAAKLERGSVVWQFSCQKCHGAAGLGDGEAAEQLGIEIPVIVAADWQYAGDIPGIRRRIYVGHDSEMPTWGLYGLKYRDIDAVTEFIEQSLRSAD